MLNERCKKIRDLFLDKLKENLEKNSPRRSGRLAGSYKKEENGISNNTPYIRYVNDGTVKQAGQHFIEKSINSTKKDFDKIVDEAKRKVK
jgi:HK97 gp10 family phage protein